MKEEQYKQFLYELKTEAGKLHFLNEGEKESIKVFPSLVETSFEDAMARNISLVRNQHIGVCFSMAAYVKEYILFSMGITDNVYFMETYDGSNGWINFVILYKYKCEWRICDLAGHVREIEECYGNILSASALMETDYQAAQKIIMDNAKRLNDDTFLSMSPEDYNKDYPLEAWKIYLDKGNENKPFFDVPTISLENFINQQASNKQKN